MKRLTIGILLATATPAYAQETTTNQSSSQQPDSRQSDRINAILGALFGNRDDRNGSNSIEAQWIAGRTPLANQRAAFDTRIDTEVRSGTLSRTSGDRARSDYRALVDLEARYGADGRFTTQERNDLGDRYGALTQALAEGGYPGGSTGGNYGSGNISVADGRAQFDARVDRAVQSRRLTRTQGIQLKTDYAALIRTEATYMRDGTLTNRERDDLETRLTALDRRVGDGATTGMPSGPADSTARLDAIARALPGSRLSAAAQAQLRVEHEDLTRLAAAYRRTSPTSEEQAYLDRRLTDLETRARVRR